MKKNYSRLVESVEFTEHGDDSKNHFLKIEFVNDCLFIMQRHNIAHDYSMGTFMTLEDFDLLIDQVEEWKGELAAS
jgi:hypothetical protein